MIKRYFLLAAALVPFFAYSQLESFDLSSYKLPEIKTHQLDFTGYFDGEHNNSINRLFSDHSSFQDDKGYKLSLIGSGRSIYTRFINKRKYQGTLSGELFLRQSGLWDNLTQPELVKKHRLDINLSFHSDNRWYFRNQWFLRAEVGYHNFNNDDYHDGEMRRNQGSYLNGGIGKGRLEPIQDARLAIYILQSLEKHGGLTRTPTDEEILVISRKISELKNARFFDARIRKMSDLTELDSLLTKMALVEKKEIQYFTHLADDWDYADGPERYAGNRYYFGFGPELPSYNSWRDASNFFKGLIRLKDTSLDWGPRFEAEWIDPINLYWDRSIYVNSSLTQRTKEYKQLVKNPESIPIMYNWYTSIDFGYSYYPNSRTVIGISSSLSSHFYQRISTVYTKWVKRFELSPGSSLWARYYISPQLKVNLNYIINYSYRNSIYESYTIELLEKGINRNFYQRLTATLLYSIF